MQEGALRVSEISFFLRVIDSLSCVGVTLAICTALEELASLVLGGRFYEAFTPDIPMKKVGSC